MDNPYSRKSRDDEDLKKLQDHYQSFVFEILGLKAEEETSGKDDSVLEGVMKTLLELRQQAKQNKDWGTADLIRNELSDMKIKVTDTKDGAVWELE